MKSEEIQNRLKEKGLKVTPQRMVILEAIHQLSNHPTADNVIDYIKKVHPNIAAGTVYKVLNVLVKNNLIKRVKTEKDIMRYDAVITHHHHIYDTKSDEIKDFFDEELDEMLSGYFKKNKLPDFIIEDIVLQIKGKSGKK